MTYFRDMAERCQFSLHGGLIRAIGWLSKYVRYDKTPMVSALRNLVMDQLEGGLYCEFYRGQHVCEFCYQEKHPGQQIGLGEEAFVSGFPSGNGVIIVPSEDYLFVAPSLIGHYIEVHGYKPPEEFIRALIDCPDYQKADLFFDMLYKLISDRPGGKEFFDNLLSVVKEEDGHHKRIAELSSIIELTEDAEALAQRANLNVRMGTVSIDDCLSDLTRAINVCAKPQWLFDRALLYHFRGDYQLEANDLTAVIERDTGDESAEFRRLLVRALEQRAFSYTMLSLKDESAVKDLFALLSA